MKHNMLIIQIVISAIFFPLFSFKTGAKATHGLPNYNLSNQEQSVRLMEKATKLAMVRDWDLLCDYFWLSNDQILFFRDHYHDKEGEYAFRLNLEEQTETHLEKLSERMNQSEVEGISVSPDHRWISWTFRGETEATINLHTFRSIGKVIDSANWLYYSKDGRYIL